MMGGKDTARCGSLLRECFWPARCWQLPALYAARIPPIARRGPRAVSRTSTVSGKCSTKPTTISKATARGRRWRSGPVRTVRCLRRTVLALGAVGAVPPSLGVVEGGEIPYKPEALKQKQENQTNWLTRDPEIKCYLPGVPRATYIPQPFRILQSANQIFVAYQYAGAVRNIYLKDPGPAPVDSWMGQSFGRWEGETLVVDVTGFNDQSWLDRAGNFHSDALHVVERYRRTSPDVIAYEATIEDPKVFTRPWKISMPLYRRQEKNAQILEFKCVEFVEELMYGQWRKTPLSR